MQGLNFGLRYDYLRGQYREDLWGGLLSEIVPFVPIALYLGGTLICSLIANVEHQTSSWKQLLALPVSRTAVFIAKLLLCLLLLIVSCLLLSAGTVVLGLLLGFGAQPIPLADILRMGFAAYAGAMPVIALQLWLSLSSRNQTLPVSLGLTLSLVSPFGVYFTEWVPLSWRPWPGAIRVLGCSAEPVCCLDSWYYCREPYISRERMWTEYADFPANIVCGGHEDSRIPHLAVNSAQSAGLSADRRAFGHARG